MSGEEKVCVLPEDPALCECIPEHNISIPVLGSALCPVIRQALDLREDEYVQLNTPHINPMKHGPTRGGPIKRGGGHPPIRNQTETDVKKT